jgi:photosystem II stability/assembly factor-like uncharacterized protein
VFVNKSRRRAALAVVSACWMVSCLDLVGAEFNGLTTQQPDASYENAGGSAAIGGMNQDAPAAGNGGSSVTDAMTDAGGTIGDEPSSETSTDSGGGGEVTADTGSGDGSGLADVTTDGNDAAPDVADDSPTDGSVTDGEAGTPQEPILVAVGEKGRAARSRNNGTTWDDVSWSVDGGVPDAADGGIAANMREVTYGAGAFVAVGEFGSTWRSPTGEAWNYTRSGNGHLHGVCYSRDHFTAVGAAGRIARSPNGSNWTNITPVFDSSDLGNKALSDIACDDSSSHEVAVGSGGKIIASTNGGMAWTMQPAPFPQELNGVAIHGGTRIAVGNNGAIFRSDDGHSWFHIESHTTTHLYAVAYGGGRWLIVGSPGVLLISKQDDGRSWLSVEGAMNDAAALLTDITYDPRSARFVALSYRGSGWYSDDLGDNWQETTVVPPDVYMNALAFNR